MRARFAASILIAGALLLGSSGCTFTAGIPTDFPYASADGADLTVGQVKVRNALLVSDGGENASLAMAVSNDGDQAVEVLFQYNFDTGTPGEFTVALAPGDMISFGSDLESAILLQGIDVQVGGDLQIFVQYGGLTGAIMRAPVYSDGLERFDEIDTEAPPVEEPVTPATEAPAEEPADTEE